jgi:hypothetical protein
VLSLRRAGYYAIPVIEGLAKASQQGANPLESVMDALKNDRASTITPASMLDKIDSALAPKK